MKPKKDYWQMIPAFFIVSLFFVDIAAARQITPGRHTTISIGYGMVYSIEPMWLCLNPPSQDQIDDACREVTPPGCEYDEDDAGNGLNGTSGQCILRCYYYCPGMGF